MRTKSKLGPQVVTGQRYFIRFQHQVPADHRPHHMTLGQFETWEEADDELVKRDRDHRWLEVVGPREVVVGVQPVAAPTGETEEKKDEAEPDR